MPSQGTDSAELWLYSPPQEKMFEVLQSLAHTCEALSRGGSIEGGMKSSILSLELP